MTVKSDERPIEVLLVEDDPADARLTEETLKGAEHRTNITFTARQPCRAFARRACTRVRLALT